MTSRKTSHQDDTSDYRAKRWYSLPDVAHTYEERRFGSTLGRWRHRMEMAALDRALAVLPRDSKVVDLACGSGRILRELSGFGLRAVGADISRPMLKEVRRRLGHSETLRGLVLCENEHLPFANGSFDAVTCIRLMSHLPPSSRAAMLGEMSRVSRRWVIVSCSVRAPLLWPWHLAQQLLGKADDTPWYPVSINEFRREMRTAGLILERVESEMPLVFSSRIFVAENDK